MLRFALFILTILTMSPLFGVDQPVSESDDVKQALKEKHPTEALYSDDGVVTITLLDRKVAGQQPPQPESFWWRHRMKILACASVLVPAGIVAAIKIAEHLNRESNQTPPWAINSGPKEVAVSGIGSNSTSTYTTPQAAPLPAANLSATASTLFSPILPSSAPPPSFSDNTTVPFSDVPASLTPPTTVAVNESLPDSGANQSTAHMPDTGTVRTMPVRIDNPLRLAQNSTSFSKPTTPSPPLENSPEGLYEGQVKGIGIGVGAGGGLLIGTGIYYLDPKGKPAQMRLARHREQKMWRMQEQLQEQRMWRNVARGRAGEKLTLEQYRDIRFLRGVKDGKLFIDPSLLNDPSMKITPRQMQVRNEMLARQVIIKRDYLLPKTEIAPQQPGPSKVKSVAPKAGGGYHTIAEVGAMPNGNRRTGGWYTEIGDDLSPERVKTSGGKGAVPKLKPHKVPGDLTRLSGANKFQVIKNEAMVTFPTKRIVYSRGPLHQMPQVPERKMASTKVICKRSNFGSCTKPAKASTTSIQHKLRKIKHMPKVKLVRLYPYSKLANKYKVFGKAIHLLANKFPFKAVKAPTEVARIKQMMPKSSLSVMKSLSGVKGALAADLIISSVFIGIDLKDDIPRWLTQSEVDAKIREHDDVIKYLRYIPIFWWTHLIQPMAEDNAMKVINEAKGEIYDLVNAYHRNTPSRYEAFRDLPFKEGADVGDGPWEYRDKSVLYKFSYAQLMSDFPVIDGKPLGKDVVNMLMRGGNKETSFFVITLKMSGMNQVVVKAGTLASLLLSENQAINELLAAVNDKNNFITGRYIKHIFKTIDVEDKTRELMAQHMRHGHMMYLWSGKRKLDAVEEHFRQDNIRYKDKLERESREKIDPVYKAIENKVKPVLETAALMQGYIETLLEDQPNYEEDKNGNIKRVDESAENVAVSEASEDLLEKKAYPVKESYEGEDQKHALKQLLSLTQQTLIRMAAENPAIKFLFPGGSIVEQTGDKACEESGNKEAPVDQRHKMTAVTAVPDVLRWQRQTNSSVELFDLYQNVSSGLNHENATSLWDDDVEKMKSQSFTFFIQDAHNGRVQYLTRVPAFSIYCAVAKNAKNSRGNRLFLPFGGLPLQEQQLLLRDALDQDINENNIPVVSTAINKVLHPVTVLVLTSDGRGAVESMPATFYQDQKGNLVGHIPVSPDTVESVTLHTSIPWQDDGSPVVLNKISDDHSEQKTLVRAEILELSQSGPGHHTYSLNQHFFQQASLRPGWWTLSTYAGILGSHQGRIKTLLRFELTEADIQAGEKIISFSVSNRIHQQMEARPEFTTLKARGSSSLRLSKYADRVPELEVKAELQPGAYELVSDGQRVEFLVTAADWNTPSSDELSVPDISLGEQQAVARRLRDTVQHDKKYGDVWLDILADLSEEVEFSGSDERSGIGFTLYKTDNSTVGFQNYLPVKTVSIKKGVGLYADSIIRLMTLCKEAEYDLMSYDLGFLMMSYASLPPQQMEWFFNDYIAKLQQKWFEMPLPDDDADQGRNRSRRAVSDEYFHAVPPAQNNAGTARSSTLLVLGLGLGVGAAASAANLSGSSGKKSYATKGQGVAGEQKSRANPWHCETNKMIDAEKGVAGEHHEAVFTRKSIVRWLQLNSKFFPIYEPKSESEKEKKMRRDPEVNGQSVSYLSYAEEDSCESLAKDLCRLNVITIFRSLGQQPANQLLPVLDKLSEVQLVLMNIDGQVESVSQNVMPYAYVLNRMDQSGLRRDITYSIDAFLTRCPQGSIQEWLDDVLNNAASNEVIIQLLYDTAIVPANYALFGVLAELGAEFVFKETNAGYRLFYVSAKGASCYQQLDALTKAKLLSDDIKYSLTLKGFFADERVREILDCCYSNVLLSINSEKGFVSYSEALSHEKKADELLNKQDISWFKTGLNWSAKRINYYFNNEDVLHYVTEGFEYVYKNMPAYKNRMNWVELAQRISKNRVQLATALGTLVEDPSVFLLPSGVSNSATSLAELVRQYSDEEWAIPFVFFPGQQNHYVSAVVLPGERFNNRCYQMMKQGDAAFAEKIKNEYTDLPGRNAFEYLNMDMQAPDYLKKLSFGINPEGIVDKVKVAMTEAFMAQTTETQETEVYEEETTASSQSHTFIEWLMQKIY